MTNSIRRGLLLILAVSVVLLCSAMGRCAVIYIKTTGNDSSDGLTWDSAKRTVQAGLNAAASGDEVWVAAGVYVELITLKVGAALYGGFAGTETSRDQRDWNMNFSILDGNQGGTAVTSPVGATATTVIDGLSIRNGYQPSVNMGGGGIYCASSSPTIANNTISGNTAHDGGGIYCLYASPTITNNTFRTNRATSKGGGIYCYTSSSPTITNNAITGTNGCGIYCSYLASPTIANNTITYSSLEAIRCEQSSSPTIVNNTITDNGQSSANAAIHCLGNSSPLIADNIIRGNATSGIWCSSASPTIVNNTITGNSSTGITSISSSSPTIANTIVAFNNWGIYTDSTGSLVLKHNCVYTLSGPSYVGLSSGETDTQVDPLFVNRAARDYHLTAASPCIDAGDDSVVQQGWVDMDGQVRGQGLHVDIGADEVPPTTLSFGLPAG